MIFSSLTYIFFLFAVVLLYWKLPQRFRIPLLLLASYVFYACWSPPWGLAYAPLLLLNTGFAYGLARAMVRFPARKKLLLILGVATQLGGLAYFKYANFLTETLFGILGVLQMPAQQAAHFDIFMPLAISFTSFILISYLVDAYKGEEKPDETGFLRFAAYVAFFPHLIAGPIVRAKELLHQFDQTPVFRHEHVIAGLNRFATGFFLKVFIADVIAVYVDMIYGNPNLQAFNTAWVASYAFSIQLFCDFFGYTLMAQGSALLMGYSLPENFNAPYFAKNMSEFWRRWHMTLSRWLKDYLYIPLGGNRQGQWKTYRNLFITMALGGLWHGANWTFVAWGVIQGVLLCMYKAGKYWNVNRFIPAAIAIFLTFHGVVFARVFFRSQSFSDALGMLNAMVNPTHWVHLESAAVTVTPDQAFMSTETAFAIVLLFLGIHAAIRYLKEHPMMIPWRGIAATAGYAALFFCLFTLGAAREQQFIYFQF